MPAILLPLLLLLAACASPSPRYFNATRHDVTLQGINFAVFQDGTSAQVIRLGYLTRRQRDVGGLRSHARLPGGRRGPRVRFGHGCHI